MALVYDIIGPESGSSFSEDETFKDQTKETRESLFVGEHSHQFSEH